MNQELQEQLKQMKRGFEQAIADARTAKGVSVQAFDGLLLMQSADHYTYQFRLRTQWEPEENSRVFIATGPDTAEWLTARVVSLEEGPTLLLATSTPISAHLLSKCTLVEDTTWLLERQLEAVTAYLTGSLQEAAEDFGAKVLLLSPVQYGMQRVTRHFGAFVPNERQQRAIAHGLGSQVTFVIGSAGTGKSAVEADLICQFLKQGLSVLAVSHTNIATDTLFLRGVQAAEMSSDADLRYLLRHQRIVRVGDARHESLLIGKYRHLTVAAIAEERMGELAHTRQQLEERQREGAARIKALERRLPQEEQRWQAEQVSLRQQIEALRELLAPLEEREQQRLNQIERSIEAEEEKRKTAEQQLLPLKERQAELEGQLLWWQEERTRRQAQLEATQQALVSLQSRGVIRRLLAGHQHELEMLAAQQAITTCQEDLDEAEQALKDLKQVLQQHRLAQIASQAALDKAEAEIKRLQADAASMLYTDQMAPHRQKLAALLEQMQAGEEALEARRAEIREAKQEQGKIEARLDDLKRQLARLKTQIVAEARLVATTITGAILNPDLLRRAVDVVIIDELSMVSVVAALLVSFRATRSLIGGGDPMQLGPILKLETRRPKRDAPQALTWLGSDLLTHLGITIFDAMRGEKGCVLLTVQGRMHPKILAPINHFVYQDILTSRPETEHAPPIGPHPEWPLMLVDSSTAPESITQKPDELKARVNPYHAEVAVALIPQILATLPPLSPSADPSVPRIGILVPYRSQTNLILQKLRQAGLAQHVHVGTVFTAQSLEYEVIIFDTVEAPGKDPFWFTLDRILDARNMATFATRLLNVGHTRARYKLIYLAHAEYIRRFGPKNPSRDLKNRRLLVELVNWAHNEGHISSKEVLHQLSI